MIPENEAQMNRFGNSSNVILKLISIELLLFSIWPSKSMVKSSPLSTRRLGKSCDVAESEKVCLFTSYLA